MAVKIYLRGGAINIEGVYADIQSINPAQFDWQVTGTIYTARDGVQNQSYTLGVVGDIQDESGTPYADAAALIAALNSFVGSSGTNSVDVNLQDQTSRPVIVKFNRVTNGTTLASDATKGDTEITLTAVTGVSVGSYIILFNPTTAKYLFATVTSVLGSPTFTIDTPLDSDFATGTFVDIGVTNLKSIGSLGTPQVYGLRGVGAPPGVDVTVDITRVIITATASDAVDLTKFINLAKLTNGLVMRRRNNVTENIFNVKDNKEISALMYDVQITAATNPNQGVDGLIGRLTFAGQNKIGVAIRLPIGDDLEILVQDDIQTAQSGESITILEVTAEGHIVED
jgi:hypothetical protein